MICVRIAPSDSSNSSGDAGLIKVHDVRTTDGDKGGYS